MYGSTKMAGLFSGKRKELLTKSTSLGTRNWQNEFCDNLFGIWYHLNMASIDKFDFNINAVGDIRALKHYNAMVGENWPVVYVLNNDEEAYVGETVNAARRTEQHLGNAAKQNLTEIRIISDKDFNKSVVLDLESYLIKHMAADGKYRLLNGNNGIQDHDYYERSVYEDKFRTIWNKLRKLGVVSRSIEDIENSELYKYSPYKSLGSEQFQTEMEILQALEQYRHS